MALWNGSRLSAARSSFFDIDRSTVGVVRLPIGRCLAARSWRFRLAAHVVVGFVARAITFVGGWWAHPADRFLWRRGRVGLLVLHASSARDAFSFCIGLTGAVKPSGV